MTKLILNNVCKLLEMQSDADTIKTAPRCKNVVKEPKLSAVGTQSLLLRWQSAFLEGATESVI